MNFFVNDKGGGIKEFQNCVALQPCSQKIIEVHVNTPIILA